MVTELSKITNNFEIVQNLAGDYEVTNYKTIYDTLVAYAEHIDDVLVVTSDEASVDGAKATKKEFKEMKDAIELAFANFMNSIDPVTKARQDLKRIFTKAEKNIDDKIKLAYEDWKIEAIEQYGRLAGIDVTLDMLDPEVFKRKQTKKSIFEAVEKEVRRLDEENTKHEEQVELVKKYAEKAGQPYEAFTPLLKMKSLDEVLRVIDKAQEDEKRRKELELERQKEEEERRAKEEARKQLETETIEKIVEDLPNFEETTTKRELWTIQLMMTESEKNILKNFLIQNGIEVVSAS